MYNRRCPPPPWPVPSGRWQKNERALKGQTNSIISRASVPNLPTKTFPIKIAWLELLSLRTWPDTRIPTLNIKIMFESNPPKSGILVRRLAAMAPSSAQQCSGWSNTWPVATEPELVSLTAWQPYRLGSVGNYGCGCAFQRWTKQQFKVGQSPPTDPDKSLRPSKRAKHMCVDDCMYQSPTYYGSGHYKTHDYLMMAVHGFCFATLLLLGSRISKVKHIMLQV